MGAMPSVSRKFFALMTTFAVFVVGVTCTQAGCLIPQILSSSKGVALKPCCEHTGTKPGQEKQLPGRSCPACESPLFSGDGSVQKVTYLSTLFVAIPVTSSLSLLSFAIDPGLGRFRLRWERPPELAPPSLLSLHCALLV